MFAPLLPLLLLSLLLVVGVRGGSELLNRCFNAGDVALTFEGGPDPNKTPLVLDALKKHNATAAFFLRATSLDGWPAIAVAKRIVAEGHVIGLLLEPTMEARGDLSLDVLASSIANHLDIIYKTVGKRPKFIRANYANTTTKFGDYLNANGHICTVPAIDLQDLVSPLQSPLRAVIMELPKWPAPIIRAHDTASLTANMAQDIVNFIKVTAGKRMVDIVNCTGMAYAYDKESGATPGLGNDIADRPLDLDGNLFGAPKGSKPDAVDPQGDSGKRFGVQIANDSGSAQIAINAKMAVAAAAAVLVLNML